MIRLINVSKTYAKGQTTVHALQDVTLDIHEGASLALIGPSGSGKSTLLALLGMMDRPSSGQVLFGGVNTSGMEDAALSRLRGQHIGFVFQAFNLLPNLTAWQNVALPLRYAGVPRVAQRQRALSVLERVGLADRADHRPTELSGGQEQRVAIARALVMDPAVILADEPTGNLDERTGEEVLDTLLGLNARGTALVVVTHSPAVAARLERVVTVRDGRLEADGAETNVSAPPIAR